MADAASLLPSRGRKVRSRKDRPCDVCRRKKVRCYLESGDLACALCRSEGFHCTFEEAPQPRKRPKRETMSPGPGTEALFELPPLASAASISSNGAASDHGYDMTFKSAIGHKQPVLEYPNDAVEHDTGTGDNFHELRDINARHHPSFRPITGSFKPQHIESTTDRMLDPTRTMKADLFKAVHPYGPKLIDLYFRIVHPIVPIVNKEETMEWLHTETNTRARSSSAQAIVSMGAELAAAPLVASLMVLGANYFHLDPATAGKVAPDVGPLRRYIRKRMQIDLRFPRLTTVQSLLLQYTFLSYDNDTTSSELWAAASALVGTAQNLGLHDDPTDWDLPLWECKLRKRIFWAMFITEKFLAHSLGRASHIHEDDYCVPMITEEDLREDARHDVFKPYAELGVLLGEVLSSLYAPRKARELAKDPSLTTNTALHLLHKLDEWQQSLPGRIRNVSNSEQIRSQGPLYMSFFTTKLSVFRSLLKAGDGAVRKMSFDLLKEIVAWSKSLTPEHIATVWPTHSKYDFAIMSSFFLALLFTAASEEEFISIHSPLQEWRWSLSVHARTFSLLVADALARMERFCVGGMTAMLDIWKHKHPVMVPTPSNTAASPLSSPTSGNTPAQQVHALHSPSGYQASQQNPALSTFSYPNSASLGQYAQQFPVGSSSLPTTAPLGSVSSPGPFYSGFPMSTTMQNASPNANNFFWEVPTAQTKGPFNFWYPPPNGPFHVPQDGHFSHASSSISPDVPPIDQQPTNYYSSLGR